MVFVAEASPASPFTMSSYGIKLSPIAVNFATAGMGGMMGKSSVPVRYWRTQSVRQNLHRNLYHQNHAGWCVVHPFNTVCVRMNLASAVAASSGGTKAKMSFPSYLSMTIREQGAMSLYSGLSAGLLRQIFYTTSRLGLFEVFRDEMAKYRPTDVWSRLSTGMVAGGIAALISCPAEVTLVRISNDQTLPAAMRRCVININLCHHSSSFVDF